MRLTWKGDKFVAVSSFAEKDIPKGAGFRWDPAQRCWWTNDTKKAARLFEFADESVKELLADAAQVVKEEMKEAAVSLEASRATDADIAIPAPKGLEYLPFQKAGVHYALRHVGTLIGDEMGLGKTIQALGIINGTSCKRVLIVVPASLRINWRNECAKWLTRPLTVGLADSKNFPNTDIVICHYDVVHRHHDAIRKVEWDLLVCDEAHFMKSGTKARRALYVLGGKGREKGKVVEVSPIPAKRRVFLTGTPILNRPVELWPLVSALAPEKFPSFWGFVNRYTNVLRTRYGIQFEGGRNLPELQRVLRETVLIRRLKSDVLTELPAKRRQVVELPADEFVGAVDSEWDVIKGHQDRLAHLRAAVEVAKAGETLAEYEAAVEALKAGVREAFTELARLRHETALSKVPYVVSHVKDTVDEGHKVVIFCHHKDVARQLEAAFDGQCVRCDGDVPLDDRQRLADLFQTKDYLKVFIGTFATASVGLTLTAASRVVFAELDWVPANVQQAEDRCHRIGQAESVLVQHLVLSGSLDAYMASRLVEKMDVIDKALDRMASNEPLCPIFGAKGVEVSRKALEEAAETVSEAERVACLGAVRYLKGLVEFEKVNKLDLPVLDILSAKDTLSAREGALVQVLVRRYAGALPAGMVAECGVEALAEQMPF
jgi:SWI/SNF-related matrix-associated actin-dependent regulator 1 of chromatin subfamily A